MKNHQRRNKKGSAKEIIMFGALVFMFAIGFFVMNFMAGTVAGKLNSNPTWNSSSAAVAATNSMQTTANLLDQWIFGFVIGFFLAMIITSFFIGGHPILMPLYIIVIVVGTIVSAILSNVWDDFTNMSIFGTTINNLPLTNHILSYLPYYLIVIGITGMIVMFARPTSQ